jgi:hypothetical protein
MSGKNVRDVRTGSHIRREGAATLRDKLIRAWMRQGIGQRAVRKEINKAKTGAAIRK